MPMTKEAAYNDCVVMDKVINLAQAEAPPPWGTLLP